MSITPLGLGAEQVAQIHTVTMPQILSLWASVDPDDSQVVCKLSPPPPRGHDLRTLMLHSNISGVYDDTPVSPWNRGTLFLGVTRACCYTEVTVLIGHSPIMIFI